MLLTASNWQCIDDVGYTPNLLYELVAARAESIQLKAERNECDLGLSQF
jgi:hypothetical protein